jgi:hypothetical protein
MFKGRSLFFLTSFEGYVTQSGDGVVSELGCLSTELDDRNELLKLTAVTKLYEKRLYLRLAVERSLMFRKSLTLGDREMSVHSE